MFLGVEKLSEIIFYLQGIQLSDLREVAKVLFQVGEGPWGLIFCLLDVLRNDFGEGVEAIFKFDERPSELISSTWTSKNATWTKSQKWCFK
jgi:hypothetical protein